nr:hypothetical protein [Bacillus cereus]
MNNILSFIIGLMALFILMVINFHAGHFGYASVVFLCTVFYLYDVMCNGKRK